MYEFRVKESELMGIAIDFGVAKEKKL